MPLAIPLRLVRRGLALALLAAPAFVPTSAHAQTLTAFGAVLAGDHEVPPNGSAALGVVSVVFVDNPAPTPDAIAVRGGFSGLEGDYSASHLHAGGEGQNGPVVFTLNATLDPSARGGEWTTENNTFFPVASAFLDSLQAGRVYANLHSAAFPGGEVRGQLRPIPLLDGDVSDALYQPLATKLNANAGFGPDIDVSRLVYYADLDNEVLFLGVAGELDVTNTNGIALWLDFAELTGTPAGTPLGGVPAAGHYMGDTGNPNFAADFEVDYLFALNPGGGAESVFLDAVKRVGGLQADYLGQTDQAGTVAIGPADDVTNSGDPAFFRALVFAFRNTRTASSGLELAIPFADLGVTAASFTDVGGTGFRAFAAVVSSTAFFSDVTVPGTVTGGNPGFNADFSTLAGGPYVSTFAPLPVELARFDARTDGDAVALAWATASETNNAGFEVQVRAPGAADFEALGFVEGAGTTTEARAYAFRTGALTPGTYAFRLRQVDFDGASTLSAPVEVAVGVPGTHLLGEVYPNPFNPRATVSLAVAASQGVRVELVNALGQRVATLFDGPMAAGEARTFALDGAGLASGLYLVRVTGERFADVRRVTLLK